MSAARQNVASSSWDMAAYFVGALREDGKLRAGLPETRSMQQAMLDVAADFARTWAAGVDQTRPTGQVVAKAFDAFADELNALGGEIKGTGMRRFFGPDRLPEMPDPPTPRAA